MILPGFPRNARFGLVVLATLALAGSAIGFTWYSVEKTTQTQRLETVQRTNAIVTGLAAGYAEQISRQILALDQTLDTMVREWEADPRAFNLEASRARSTILSGISRDMFLADESGVIRQSSVPDFIGQSAGDLDVFHDAAEHANDKSRLYLGSVAVNPIMRQWHLDAVRTLHHPDGSFAGIIDADYRVSAITDVFAASAQPGDGFAALVNLTDGKLRATFGAAGGTQDANIADTKMFEAVDTAESGLWVGPSATDAVLRIHAFRRIAGRDLAVIVGMNEQEAMQPVAIWRWQARVLAGAVTGLAAIIAVLVLGLARTDRRLATKVGDVQADFAAAHALAEVARAHAEATDRRLHATFAAIADGIAIFDAHLNLVEWNGLFPGHAGVNASLIRTGMPMEDVLRAQATAGYFGAVEDVGAEVERRITLLRAGNFGASLNFQAAGRVIGLRCRPLAEGGFVALYTDATEARRTKQLLHEARETPRLEHVSHMRFLDVISYELSTRVAMLTRTVARLRAMDVPARAVDRIRRVAESLANLATDTVEVPLMEAGSVTPRPALIGVRPLLKEVVEWVRPDARDRGITVYQVVNESMPAELIVDPQRLRRILTILLTEALRFAAPETIWVLADGGGEPAGTVALRVSIRGFGTPIPEAMRTRMFPPFDAVAVPGPSGGTVSETGGHVMDTGTGLGPAIARHLTTLMGGQLRCEEWSTIDGRTGNDFILTLPPDLLPGQRGRTPGEASAKGRPLPRTLILLAGALTGSRMAAVTMLRRDGHRVEAVATGEAAVRSLRDAPHDIAFIDAVLPDMTGLAAVAAIRDLPAAGRTVAVIVLAAPIDEVDVRLLREAGAVEVLSGDPTPQQFSEAIGRHVWLRQAPTSGPGSTPGLAEETEEGMPILSTERITELRANIPPEELLDMVEACIADLFHRLPPLRRSLALGSLGTITAQAHAMMGMAAGYGMVVLEARLRAILTAVHGRRLDTVDGAADVIETDLTLAAAALRRTLAVTQPAASKLGP